MDDKTSLQELNKAERDWERAKLNLETVKQNADKAVVDAQYNLANAEDALANMKVDTLDVELKQAQVTSAQTALDEALARLKNTTVVAPFDGVVSAVNVEAGDTVNAGTVIIKIVDPSDIEVSAIVDEIDVAQVQVGQKATVTLDAYSDLELSGVVSSISSFANSQSGVVSYPVTIKLTIPSGVQLREGMSATATITVQEVDNVLLVPTKAISGKNSANPTVVVMVNGTSEVRSVKLGASNGTSTEVVSGLNAGDMVVVTSTSSTSSSSSSIGSQGGFVVGGFGDGGGMIPIGR
jgi:RND family efflux transporter MFP subunit